MTNAFPANLNLEAVTIAYIEEALRRGGGIVPAAKMLGLTRHALKRRMTKHGIADPRDPLTKVDDPDDVLL